MVEEARHYSGHAAALDIAVVPGFVAQEQDVGRAALPVVIGVGEEVAHGIAVEASVGKFVVKVLTGDESCLQTEALTVHGEAAPSMQKFGVGDDQVVGAVSAALPTRGKVEASLGCHQGKAVCGDIKGVGLVMIFENRDIVRIRACD